MVNIHKTDKQVEYYLKYLLSNSLFTVRDALNILYYTAGFNEDDSKLLTSIKERKKFTSQDKVTLFKVMPKYWKQYRNYLEDIRDIDFNKLILKYERQGRIKSN